jgi:glycerophosphoryl diester phosphodiesterase
MKKILPSVFPVPGEDDLQSGDLLFPKKAQDYIPLGVPKPTWNFKNFGLAAEYSHKPLGELLASDAPKDSALKSDMAMLQGRMVSAFGAEMGVALQALDLPLVLYLYRLLFDEVAEQVVPVLQDLNLAFGHVAMLFEEAGEWFVMEAGCTDYSHYRVSIAPYWDAEDANRPPGQKRSWALRRADLGQSVWTARHKEFTQEKLSLVLAECKNWLGVPYGILERGMMANPDRIYCSELIQRGFDKAGLTINQKQDWLWVLARLASGDATWSSSKLKVVRELFLKRFPLLSPGMIYESPLMTHPFKPCDASGVELEYMR